MIKVSIGSAIELGLKNGMLDIVPTTAYLMIGEKCDNKCLFCSQSLESSARKDKLSRVLWPSFEENVFINSIKNYSKGNIKRICLQVMGSEDAILDAKEFVKKIRCELDMPISVSAKVENENDALEFFELGADKIGLAIDCANKEAYEKIKGKNFHNRVDFIKNISRLYKGKISTHIIVGLEETQEEIFDLYEDFLKNDVTVSLFAFTPVKGTKLEDKEPPAIEDYRKVQLMTYLLKRGYKKDNFVFENGALKDIVSINQKELEDINKGIPFEIAGCKDCNRPYYNERPGGTIYNYSRPLNNEEIKMAISDLNIKIYK